MGGLGFRSLIGIKESFYKKRRSKRQCIHGYSFQSLIGIRPLCVDAKTDTYYLWKFRVAQINPIKLLPKRG